MELAIVVMVLITVLRIVVPLTLTALCGKMLYCLEERWSESY
ncbi:MAG: hypothetical protein MAG451_03246 [Anaerolineales bacterium]|nr:hypothetical protein [Anaerolineales bacterium]